MLKGPFATDEYKETPNQSAPNNALLLNLIHVAVGSPVRTKDQQSAENILRVFMHLNDNFVY